MHTFVGAPMSDTDLFLGRIIAERFRVLHRLGSGGMGAVYVAVQENLGREVALKVIRADLVGDPEIGMRFEREARAVARLNHPNVVVIHDFGTTADGLLFIAMERLNGETVGERIRRTGPMSVTDSVRTARDVASALVAAHQAGIIHRDLKPENIMLVSNTGRVDDAKVLDFGVAKLTQDSGTAVTAARFFIGTPGYVAPEVIIEGRSDDPRSDLYALGLVLYEMLTGAPAYRASTPGATMVEQVRADPPSLTTRFRGQLPASLLSAMNSLMARDPEKRTTTAIDAKAMLDNVLRELASTDVDAVVIPAAPLSPQTSSGQTLALYLSDGSTVEDPAALDTVAGERAAVSVVTHSALPTPSSSSSSFVRANETPDTATRLLTDEEARRKASRAATVSAVAAVVLTLLVGALGFAFYARGDDAKVEIPDLAVNANVAAFALATPVAAADARAADDDDDDDVVDGNDDAQAPRATDDRRARKASKSRAAKSSAAKSSAAKSSAAKGSAAKSSDAKTNDERKNDERNNDERKGAEANVSSGSKSKSEVSASKAPPALTSDLVRSAIAQSLGKASTCTNTNIKWSSKGSGLLVDHCPSYPTLKGSQRVSITLSPSGEVLSASLKDPSMASARIAMCFLTSLKAWKFPAFAGTEPVTIAQTVEFSPCVPINGKCVF